jgi:hypothetical protein
MKIQTGVHGLYVIRKKHREASAESNKVLDEVISVSKKALPK